MMNNDEYLGQLKSLVLVSLNRTLEAIEQNSPSFAEKQNEHYRLLELLSTHAQQRIEDGLYLKEKKQHESPE